MLVRKHIISPGKYWFLDEESGQPACLDATAQRIQRWHDEGNKMLSAGLSIPVPVEHQKEAHPLTRSERAANMLKNNAGWVQKYEMDKDGGLFSVLDIQDESIIPKLPRTIRWTSPWISSFMDGDGKPWQEVIGHVALTSRPRITKQQPFANIDAAMSYAASATPRNPRQFALSQAGLLIKVGDSEGGFAPAYPMAFSMWSGGIALSEGDMEKAKKKVAEPPKKEGTEGKPPAPKPEGGPPKPEGETPPADGMPETPQVGPDGLPMPESIVDADGDISVWDVICDLLASEGYDFPEGTTGDNFAERCYTLLMDKLKGKAMADKEGLEMSDPNSMPTNQPPVGPRNDLPRNPIVQEAQPMYMSIDDMKKAIASTSDETYKGLLTAMLSMQENNAKESAALKKNAFDAAKVKRQERINRLSQKAKNKEFTDGLNAMASSASFSLSDDGVVVDSMAQALDTMEKGIRDIPALLSMPGIKPHVEPHPQDTTEGMSPERAKEVADEQMKNSGIAPAAA